MIDKARLLDALRARVRGDLEAAQRQQRDTQEATTHEQNRPEHAKDMRSTEQSYVARGLAHRVEELRHTLAALAALAPRDFGPDDAIAVTALVSIETDDEDGAQSWWIVASAGGYELTLDGRRVRTITPVSPLGRALLGLQAGDEVAVQTPAGERRFGVVAVR